MKQSTIKDFFKILREDEGYRQSWVSNIAMSYLDNERWYKEQNNLEGELTYEQKHEVANLSAKYFMFLLLSKRCDWMEVVEKLYYEKNPTTTMDVPSSVYEIGYKWYIEWQNTEDEDFYEWCLKNK